MFHEIFNFYVIVHCKKVIVEKMLLNHYFSPKPYLLERLATPCVPILSLSTYVSVYEVVSDSLPP